ncbi:hypothetical protein DL769_000218 [Monosporascus sp. CRB-8-3]|nr:hypothetical protein DL769_000218 [Monosporascus sp. CRB-8-3]
MPLDSIMDSTQRREASYSSLGSMSGRGGDGADSSFHPESDDGISGEQPSGTGEKSAQKGTRQIPRRQDSHPTIVRSKLPQPKKIDLPSYAGAGHRSGLPVRPSPSVRRHASGAELLDYRVREGALGTHARNYRSPKLQRKLGVLPQSTNPTAPNLQNLQSLRATQPHLCPANETRSGTLGKRTRPQNSDSGHDADLFVSPGPSARATPSYPLTGHAAVGYQAPPAATQPGTVQRHTVQQGAVQQPYSSPTGLNPAGQGNAPRQQTAGAHTPEIPAAMPPDPGRSGKRKKSMREALILTGQVPANGPKCAKRGKRSLMEDLCLNGRPTDNVCGRPRFSTAPGSEEAVPQSQKTARRRAIQASGKVVASAPAPAPVRPFLVPVQSVEVQDDEGENGNTVIPPRPLRRRQRLPTPRAATPPGFQPEREIASKSTAFHQLYFPSQLNRGAKANAHRWNDRPSRPGQTVFVLTHQVDDEILETRVYVALKDANADVLKIMAHDHPEAFAVSSVERHNGDDGGENVKVKLEEPERAQSVLRDMEARPTALDRRVLRVEEGGAKGPITVEESHVIIKDEDPENGLLDATQPNPLPETNRRGEILLCMGPDVKYCYWGEWKFVSHCLKMEARMRDGKRIKVFASLKNLRKPRVTS